MELLEIFKHLNHANTPYVQTTLLITGFLSIKSPKFDLFLKFLVDKKLIGWLFEKEFFNGIITTLFNFIIYYVSIISLAILFSRPLNIELTDEEFNFFITGLTVVLNIAVALPIYVLLYIKAHNMTLIQAIKKISKRINFTTIIGLFDTSKILISLWLVPFNYNQHFHLPILYLIFFIFFIITLIFKVKDMTDIENKKATDKNDRYKKF